LYLSLEEQSKHTSFVGSYLKELCRILAPCWIWILFNFQLEHVEFSICSMSWLCLLAHWDVQLLQTLVTWDVRSSQPSAIWDQRQCVCVCVWIQRKCVCVCVNSVNAVCVCESSGSVCVWIQRTHAVVAILGNEDNFFYLQSKQLIPREKIYNCIVVH
jgi:hypothetical protein